MALMDILNQLTGHGGTAEQHFDQVTQVVPSDVVADGLAHAFRSDQTPDIGAMVGQLFGNSSGTQQAGMLNQILATLGPAVAASLGGGALGSVMSPGSTQVTPAQASQLSPEQVHDVVETAED